MLGLVTTYDAREHSLIPGDVDAFVKNLVRNDPTRKGKLFIVRYEKHDTFVIAEWLGRPKDIFVDVLNLGNSLGNFDDGKAKELCARLFAPITMEQVDTNNQAAESDFLHERQDWDDASEERVRDGVIIGPERWASPDFMK